VKKVLLLCLLLVACPSVTSAQSPTGGYPGAQPVNAMKGKGVHYLYLVRHGIYDRDTTATDDRTSNGLNALGHEQAKLVGARLAGLPIKMTHLVSSEFLRAAQTADDMAPFVKLTPTRDASLNECTPSSSNAALMAGEKPGDVAACDSARAVAWSRWFVPTPDRDTYDVLVCHGNVIRWTLMRTVGADTKSWLNSDVGNCSLTIVAVRPDGSLRLVMYSDVGHIPWEKQTWSGKGGGWVSTSK
jgi:serine/threonine-protein phosphatase PGAM5